MLVQPGLPADLREHMKKTREAGCSLKLKGYPVISTVP